MNEVTYISRADWNAGPLHTGHVVPLTQFVGLVVHHTVIVLPDYDHDGMIKGDIDDMIRYMQQLQRARPDLGPDVPYSFVGFEGEHEDDVIVAEGRGFGVTGAHTIGYNSSRYGYAFAGDFTNHAPTAGMWNGVRWIGNQLTSPTDAQPTLEHRDVYATQCPGNATETPAPAQPPFTIKPTPSPGDGDDMTTAFIIAKSNGATPPAPASTTRYLSTDGLFSCRWVQDEQELDDLVGMYKFRKSEFIVVGDEWRGSPYLMGHLPMLVGDIPPVA